MMKVKWNRVHFEPEPERKYLVWWNTKHGGVFAVGEYRERLGDMGPIWSASGDLQRGKLVEFWAELPDAPSKDD